MNFDRIDCTVFSLARSFSRRALLLSLCLVAALAAHPARAQAQPPPTIYNVQTYGAVGDGSTNDTSAINNAIKACHEAGGGTVFFPPTAGGYSISANGSGGIMLRSGVNLQGVQTKIKLSGPGTFISAESATGGQAVIQADTMPTNTNLLVDSSATFVVGDNVLVQLGQAAYDTGEPDDWFFAIVAAVPDSTHITLDRPVAYTLNHANVMNNTHKSITRITDFMEGNKIDGFDLYSPDATNYAESGIAFTYAKNISLSNISGENPGAGLICLQYCTDVDVTNTNIRRSIAGNNHQLSKGRCYNIAESNNVQFTNCYGADFEHDFAFIESRSDVHFQNVKIVNNFVGRPAVDNAAGKAINPLFTVVGNAQASVDGLTVEGNTSYVYASNYGGDMTIRDLNWQAADLPLINDMSILDGRVNINAGYLATYLWKDLKEYHVSIPLYSNNGTPNVPLPAGLYKSIRAYVTSTSGLNGVYLDGGIGYDDARLDTGQLVSGVSNTLGGIGIAPISISFFNGSHTNNGLGTRSLGIYTNGISGSDNLILDISYWPLSSQVDQYALSVMAKATPGNRLRASPVASHLAMNRRAQSQGGKAASIRKRAKPVLTGQIQKVMMGSIR